jgi:putative hydrolase of the HAD superfamily
VELKAVCFDAAGTLFDTVRPIGESYASLANRYGMEVSALGIEERFRSCFSKSPPLAFREAHAQQLKDLERGWWKDLVRRIFEPYGPFPRFEDCFAELFTHFSKAESWALFPDTQETLAALKRRGLILQVISNFDSRVIGILDGLGIASWFDSVVFSSQVGYAKPAPEIFHHALGMHHLKAQQAMHVGDSLINDALGASQAGLRAVWLNRNGSAAPQSLPQVRSLKEIVSLCRAES